MFFLVLSYFLNPFLDRPAAGTAILFDGIHSKKKLLSRFVNRVKIVKTNNCCPWYYLFSTDHLTLSSLVYVVILVL